MFNSNAQKAIVLHKTAGDATPQAIYNTFLASGNPGKSVHYGVGQDGSIWQYVPESLGSGGNCCTEAGYDPFWAPYVNAYGNLNLCTLSIEHCDPSTDNSTPLTAAQQEASFKLVAYLAKKYSIPASHIKTHASIDPQSRARCPGNYPMAELLAYVQQGGSMGVPDGWKPSADGKTLTAPNGHKVVLGFGQWVLDHNWEPDNVPQEDEVYPDQVQLHNLGLGKGSRQCFRDNILWYTAKDGVIQEPYLGLEIKACYDQIASQEAEIATLKAQLAQTQQPANTADAITQLHTIASASTTALKDLGVVN